MRTRLALTGLVLLAAAGCGDSPGTRGGTTRSAAAPLPLPPTTPPAPAPSAASAPSVFHFDELSNSSGIDFVHVSGMDENRYFVSANGSGAAFLDYDGDGRMDLYFATCNMLPMGPNPKAQNKLYRNLGGGKFQDVTDAAGVGFRGFTHGVIASDYDNDGDPDLFLCNYGSNVLYLNNGDGTFRDVSEAAGIATPNWSSGGAALDYDNDGDLDLYVTNYGSFDMEKDGARWCGNEKKHIRQYCAPMTITPARHFLYRNDGMKDGVPHFTDVIVEAGIGRTDGHGFGVVAIDLNDDGWIDLFVANDQNPSFLFINKKNGTFADETERSGAAYDENGKKQSGMGVDAEDADGDGLPDLIRTNFREESTAFYQNQGRGLFLEQSTYVGLAGPSLPYVKWGCALADFDNDGNPDVFVANGHVDDNYHLLGDEGQPYSEPPLMFHNDGSRSFVSCGLGSGAYFDSAHVARGAAFGDLDDDGRLDIVVNHKDGAPGVLLNHTPGGNHWLRLKLRGGPRRTATPSARRSRSRSARPRSIAKRRGEAAWNRPTTPAS